MSFALPDRVLFGAAYYHEYQPSPRLKKDLDLMVEASFSVIRVGESVWSTWEPDDGVLDLDWLQPVLDGAHERGIDVILGTPTYAIPMWLARRYPEIAGEPQTGQPRGWGSRQEVDYSHPAFLFHAERIIRAIIARYANHPAIIGYQVDNEPGLETFHNHGAFQRFVDKLRTVYKDVETLNEEWGLTYWSHRLSTWADLWTPDNNRQPQYNLAWRQFQADITTSFITWQADIVREYASPEQFITTCIAYTRPSLDDESLARNLDLTAGNPYYRMQDSLALPVAGPSTEATTSGNWSTAGNWSTRLHADRMFASRQEPYLITETNAQAIGPSHTSEPAYDGQWRQVAWMFVSRGARMVEYWHWHTLHWGTETYWGGILPHDQEPGRVYEQLSQLGHEFATAGPLVAGLEPDSDVAFLFSHDSKWAMEFHPPLHDDDRGPDPASYYAIFDAFYRGAFDAGLQARIFHPTQLLGTDAASVTVAGAVDLTGSTALPYIEPAEFAANHGVLVVAGAVIADDALLQWLDAYAAAGGHLVLGPRTGYEDQEARARQERKPALLDTAAGVWYNEFSNLTQPLGLVAAPHSPLQPGSAAAGGRWIDGLQVLDAQVLLTYDHPHFSQWPAVTTRQHGAGRVTVVGTVPNPTLARSLAEWLVEGSDDPWRPVRTTSGEGPEDSVTITGATATDGSRVRFVHNWSWTPTAITVSAPVRDVLSSVDIAMGERLELDAWDVRVLVER